jgi:hypothetical protein
MSSAAAELDASTIPTRRDTLSLDHEALDAIRQALRGLRYGQIIVVVQDGVVVQVDRTERRRLRLNGRA